MAYAIYLPTIQPQNWITVGQLFIRVDSLSEGHWPR